MRSFVAVIALLAFFAELIAGFAPLSTQVVRSKHASQQFMSSDDFIQETPEATKERIEALIENHPVILFMKGNKLFPQCG